MYMYIQSPVMGENTYLSNIFRVYILCVIFSLLVSVFYLESCSLDIRSLKVTCYTQKQIPIPNIDVVRPNRSDTLQVVVKNEHKNFQKPGNNTQTGA